LVGIILGGIYSFSMSPLQINNTIITDNQEEKITKKDEYEIKILN
jgi:hypothetical protein